jgi:hypothetical protein
MLKPKLRARYKVVGPKKVKRVVNKAFMDDTKSLQQKKVVVEEERYTVYFPQGHSLTLTKEGLIEQGLHVRPRIVDMNTGDVLEAGGDPYDFGEPIKDFEVELSDDSYDPEADVELHELIADNSASKSKQKVA